MAKIEVVVPGAEAAAVREVFKVTGVTGFTSVTGVSGLGHDGYHQGKLLFNDKAPLEMLITVVPTERVDALLAGLRPLLEQSSGVMFLSDTFVSRPEYFT
jgi:nitrogen regulatory protein PII